MDDKRDGSDPLEPQDRDRLLAIVTALERLKGEETCVLDVRRFLVPTSFMVITSAGSPRQMRALLEAVEAALDEQPLCKEGRDSPQWAVLDYGGVIVHVLSPAARAFYELEELWGSQVVSLDRR